VCGGARMTQNGTDYSVISQDIDKLLFFKTILKGHISGMFLSIFLVLVLKDPN